MEKKKGKLMALALAILSGPLFLLSAHSNARADGSDGKGDDYELVFSDEFDGPDGSQPDSAVWSRKGREQSNCNRYNSNSEKVAYIEDGCLVCRAIPNRSEPGDTARMLAGSVWTFGKYNVKYGRIEVRMRTNNLSGNFPAAWLKWQPKNWATDPYMEIDIVEMLGNRGRAYHTAHSKLTVSDSHHGEKNTFNEKTDVTEWHVYGIVWTPDDITWTLDGETVGTYHKSTDKRLLARGQWTFDVPCYIVLNQSLGDGRYEGMQPDYDAVYETRFDWIRVYKRAEK